MAISTCGLCGQQYGPNSCNKTHIKYTPKGELKNALCGEDHVRTMTQVLPRNKVGAFNDMFTVSQYKELGRNTCHDCGAAIGGYHHEYCDGEICPRCGHQLLSCDCWDNYDLEFLDGWIDEELASIATVDDFKTKDDIVEAFAGLDDLEKSSNNSDIFDQPIKNMWLDK